MLDPKLSLAFSLYSSPGVYAVLIGSGVSREAGIPTGWEVTLDLVTQLAVLSGEESEGLDPENWYQDKFEKPPLYDDVVALLGNTSSERRNLLSKYFEPVGDERERGLKTPSKAHISIAKLMVAGYVNVVLTTNFDRLMELAIEAEGVTPSVLSSVDAIMGANPLRHSGPTVVKLHGDYLDSRIRNTESELSTYPAALDALLDTIFDEFGLIVCGWSADYDAALRSAISRCPSRRFSTYWATFGNPSPLATDLIGQRAAIEVPIDGAGAFFSSLLEKVESIRQLSTPHPATTAEAVTSVKRYLAPPGNDILLHDLVLDVVNSVVGRIEEQSDRLERQPSAHQLRDVIGRIDAELDCLLGVLIAGTYWGSPGHKDLWVTAIQRVLDSLSLDEDPIPDVRRYYGVLCLYAVGISCVMRSDYDLLKELFWQPKMRFGTSTWDSCRIDEVCRKDAANEALSEKGSKWLYPMSVWMRCRMRNFFEPKFLSREKFDPAFERFEAIFALYFAAKFYPHLGRVVFPLASYCGMKCGESQIDLLLAEIVRDGSTHPLLETGLVTLAVDDVTGVLRKISDAASQY